ncbi:MAG: GvpL/GvpF family gas vesicle protein [Candidatus Fermentithermobacillus carboniphilus]|uniref:GvpL/GvpF family gas vesicle protein n=1 Tax=Candidatus Fermentithermobacillus carboniphilus TaxID=3085328 RepID=A0AAT9LE15_9FIRM|nr:MAG: GvpL/GvpF family gas vesicle protein [Candidatus Fermentithermobacillus carboniphilus]
MAKYVYAIVRGTHAVDLGPIGIDNCRVYTIPYQTISAVVHDCPPKPYQSSAEDVVKEWVKTHQNVIDKAVELFGLAIPMGFDTIVGSLNHERSAEEALISWLARDNDRILEVFQTIEGKDEYAVKVFYDRKALAEICAREDETIRRMKEEIAGKSPGLAHMYRQKLEKVIKSKVDDYVSKKLEFLHAKIEELADDVIVERAGKIDGDKVLLLNLSCLVKRTQVEALGEVLETVGSIPGFSVHFSGPWPAYSFVAKISSPAPR